MYNEFSYKWHGMWGQWFRAFGQLSFVVSEKSLIRRREVGSNNVLFCQ